MSGTYTIDPAGTGPTNFTTFTAAVTALTNNGISGPVTFNVAAATYTGSYIIRPITGASASNTITFNGGVGNAATRILQSTDSFVVKLWGADYINFRNLTFNAIGTVAGYGIRFMNTSTSYPGNPCDHNQITNCVINTSLTATSSLFGGINASGVTYSSSGNAGNYNLIQNNEINGGYFGIYWNGYGSTYSQEGVGNEFLNNTVQNFYYYGLYVTYNQHVQIIQNTILGRASVTTTQYGLYVYYCDYGGDINKNSILTAYYGMRIYYCNRDASGRMTVSNNMISGTLYATGAKYMVYLYYSYKVDFWYNTFRSHTSSTTYGLYCGGSSTVAYNHDVRNNIMAITGTGSTSYVIYHTTSPTTGNFFQTLDYNQYWCIPVGTRFRVNNNSYNDLASMQFGLPLFNQHSVWGDPYFYSLTDLHARSTVGYLTGTPVSVYDDIDGQPRNALTPCMGADEFPEPPPEKDVKVVNVFAGYSTPNLWSRTATYNTPIRITVQNAGKEGNPTSLIAQYQVDANPPVVQTFSGITWNGDLAVLSFTTPYVAPAEGDYSITAVCDYAGDEDPTNNSESLVQHFNDEKIYGSENFDQFDPPGFGYPWPYPLPGFFVINGGGFATWQTSTGVGTGGSVALEYPGDVTQANDWIFFPAANLAAGSSYRVRFQYRAELAGNPQTFGIYAGPAPNPFAMTLLNNGAWVDRANTSFEETRIGVGTYPYFNTAAAGNYYLGIHVSSAANRGRLFIDNVVLDVNPAPPPKIGFRYESPATAPYIDDPSTARIDLSAIYRTPGTINRRYQVTNTTNLYGLNGFMLWKVSTATPWIKVVMDAAATIPQPNPFTPAWPRENQYFQLVIDPTTMQPGIHHGMITFNGELWNSEYPTSGPGLTASNQPFNVPVTLLISTNGAGGSTTANVAVGTNLDVGTHPLVDDDGKTLATVTVTAGLIPQITVTEYPNQMPPHYSRMRYVRKYWTIDATGSEWTADIQLYYTDTEANAGGIVNRGHLRGWRKAGWGPWAYAGTGSTSSPDGNAVQIYGLTPANISGYFACATRWNHAAKSPGNEGVVSFDLAQNYPNPVTARTRIEFSVPEAGPVALVVYNSLGVEVARLLDEDVDAGAYSIPFDAGTLPPGMYLYRLTAGTSTATRFMSLVR